MSNEQKTPLARSINQAAINRVQDFIQIAGKALPCTVVSASGPMVIVAFQVTSSFTLPQITVPIAESEYVRLPIKKDCRGVVYPADVPLGGISGLGSGTPSLTAPPNLTGLVFFPIGNTAFQATDPNTLTLYGEPGVLVREKTNASSVGLAGGTLIAAGMVGNFNFTRINLNGAVYINGQPYLLHVHKNGGGQGDSGPVGP